MPAARTKDGGADAATLAWVLSEVKVNHAPSDLHEPITEAELQAFIDDLRSRLARLAFSDAERRG